MSWRLRTRNRRQHRRRRNNNNLHITTQLPCNALSQRDRLRVITNLNRLQIRKSAFAQLKQVIHVLRIDVAVRQRQHLTTAQRALPNLHLLKRVHIRDRHLLHVRQTPIHDRQLLQRSVRDLHHRRRLETALRNRQPLQTRRTDVNATPTLSQTTSTLGTIEVVAFHVQSLQHGKVVQPQIVGVAECALLEYHTHQGVHVRQRQILRLLERVRAKHDALQSRVLAQIQLRYITTLPLTHHQLCDGRRHRLVAPALHIRHRHLTRRHHTRQRLHHNRSDREASNATHIPIITIQYRQLERHRVTPTQSRLHHEERPLRQLALALLRVLSVLLQHAIHGRTPERLVEERTTRSTIIELEELGVQTQRHCHRTTARQLEQTQLVVRRRLLVTSDVVLLVVVLDHHTLALPVRVRIELAERDAALHRVVEAPHQRQALARRLLHSVLLPHTVDQLLRRQRHLHCLVVLLHVQLLYRVLDRVRHGKRPAH